MFESSKENPTMLGEETILLQTKSRRHKILSLFLISLIMIRNYSKLLLKVLEFLKCFKLLGRKSTFMKLFVSGTDHQKSKMVLITSKKLRSGSLSHYYSNASFLDLVILKNTFLQTSLIIVTSTESGTRSLRRLKSQDHY